MSADVVQQRGRLLGVASGFRLPFEGLRLLVRERRLWPLASVPVVLSLLAIAATVILLYAQADALHAFVAGWLPVLDVGAWYTWLWVGPARLILWLVGSALFVLASGLALVASLLAASLVASPFLDALSRRVERIEHGEVIEAGDTGLAGVLREARRALVGELRRVLFFVGVWIAIVTVCLIVPGLQLLAAPMLAIFAMLFLPLEYAGYVLDRRALPFRARRAWVQSDWPRMIGFGAAGICAGLVPGLNLLLLPALVVAGTLLALRHPPDPSPS